MTVARSKYAGVAGILQYNAHYYVASLCILIGAGTLLGLRHLPRAVESILIGAAGVTAFWSVSSLIASYYVYDYAGVTRWNWIPAAISCPRQRWLNIHAGLDESTQKLSELFPNTQCTVIDIYDPLEMTEPSIARARRAHRQAPRITNARLDALPVPDKDCDAIFLLFTAHEIRRHNRRVTFFRELSRVLADSGELLLVEHLRDWNNFVAFGPGFLHFFSRHEWIRVANEAGLTLVREQRLTPLVRYFLMKKAGDYCGGGAEHASDTGAQVA